MLSRAVHAGLKEFYRRTGLRTTFSDLYRELRSADSAFRTVFVDWPRVRGGVGRLELSEYLSFNLHRLQGLSRDDRRAFAGWRAQEVLVELLSDEYSMILNLDKVTFNYVARGSGLGGPEIFAVFSPQPRPGEFHKLTNARELEDFLAGWRRFPIYCKPSCGGSGAKNFQIEGMTAGRALLDHGDTISVEDLAARMTERTGFGYLLTEVLRPHDAIADVAGDSISGVRLHVLRMKKGPVLFMPVWKVARRGAVVDNFQHGESGNMLAAVDVQSGRVERVVTGRGFRQRVNEPHPDTLRPLVGFQLPHWQTLTEMVREGAELFPGFLCQAWDVALCGHGPVVMEVNWFGDLELPQIAHGRGFLQGDLLGLLRERNIESQLGGRYAHMRRGKYARSWVCPNGRFGKRKAHWPYSPWYV